MADVVARAARVALVIAEQARCGIPELLSGLGFSRTELERGRTHVSWDDFTRLWERLELRAGGQAGLERLIRLHLCDAVAELYPEAKLIGWARPSYARLFPLTTSVLSLDMPFLQVSWYLDGEARLALRLEVPEELRGSEAFFRVIGALLRAAPAAVKLPAVEVSLVTAPHHGRYLVQLSEVQAARPRRRLAQMAELALGPLQLAADQLRAVSARRPASHREDLSRRIARLRTRWALSQREAEVAALVARGLTNKDIAATLSRSESTVEVHISRALRKTGQLNRASLIALVWSAD